MVKPLGGESSRSELDRKLIAWAQRASVHELEYALGRARQHWQTALLRRALSRRRKLERRLAGKPE